MGRESDAPRGETAPDLAPLRNIRVLDFGTSLTVAAATQILADLGCDVIKVEHRDGRDPLRQLPAGRTGMSDDHFVFNRSKRSLSLDLEDPSATEILYRLVSSSRVAVADATTSALTMAGLSPEDLLDRSDGLTFCTFGGVSATDATPGARAFDLLLQALSGAMDLTGAATDPPTRTGAPVCGLLAGTYGAVTAIAALVADGDSARPRLVEISPLQTSIALLSNMASAYLTTGTHATRLGTGHISIFPYNSFETADGHVVVAIFTQGFWGKFCHSIGAPELADEARFRTIADRMTHRAELSAILETTFRSRTTAEWSERLEAADVPFAPVLSVADALEHPQTSHRGMTPRVRLPGGEWVRTVGSPLRYEYSDGRSFVPMPKLAPRLGEHDGQYRAEALADRVP